MDPIPVLVVDDEPGIALLCQRMLTRAGYEVVALTDPREALEWLAHNRASLLVVDIRMPEIDGFEVISRASELQPDLAVLVMTGFGTLDTAIRALRQGVDGLLLKPFDSSEELVAAATQALADSQRKRDAARIQALQPLFEVTESLLSETRSESLLELMINAILGHLRCSAAAYYEHSAVEGRFVLRAGQGKQLPEFIIQVDASGSPMLINSAGPGDPGMQARLTKAEIGAALFVPIVRQSFRGVFFAGRDLGQQGFLQADLDMLQILARQAAAALENARLYDEERSYVRQIEESQAALLQAEKMAAAGRLSASIAHEINNPLQSIQNCLHLAAHEDLEAPKRREYFDMARAEVDRLSVTVQRMLDFYRPGGVTPEALKIGELLQRIIHLTEKQLSERGIAVLTEVPETLPEIVAVSSQLQQVFMNLILNSYDAMPGGGELSITCRAANGGVEVFFQDNGPGVSQEDASSVFEPFFTTKEGGSGLGLTISYNIIAAHGGSLELAADQGKGACFRVFLPIGEMP
jgi:signal transduction histidine kinase/CheY-like chemotaxis protein